MSPCSAIPRALLLGFLAALAPGALLAESPFVPEGRDEPARPESPSEPPKALEKAAFDGILSFDGEVSFSLRDVENGESYWIGLGETAGGFTVEGFDAEAAAIEVSYQGARRTLSLSESAIVAMHSEVASEASGRTSARRKLKPKGPPKSAETLRQEEEARALVTTILTVGMEERAKRRAALEERRLERLRALRGE